MDILSLLVSWQFLFLSLAIVALTYIFRLVVEGIFKKAANNRIFRDVILPIFPIVTGGLFAAFAVQFSYPELMSSLSSRVVFGLVAGLLSAQVYKVVKGMIANKIPK